MVNDTLYLDSKDTIEYTEIKLNNWREFNEPPMSTNMLVAIAFILVGIAVMITRPNR